MSNEAIRLLAWVRWRGAQAVEAHDACEAFLEQSAEGSAQEVRFAHEVAATLIACMEAIDALRSRAESAALKLRNRLGTKADAARAAEMSRWPPEDVWQGGGNLGRLRCSRWPICSDLRAGWVTAALWGLVCLASLSGVAFWLLTPGESTSAHASNVEDWKRALKTEGAGVQRPARPTYKTSSWERP